MYICYTDKYVYSLYERSFFDVQRWYWGPRQKISIITFTICVYHTAMPIISAHEDQHHICQHIYIYIFDLHGPRHIQKTRPKLIAIEPK